VYWERKMMSATVYLLFNAILACFREFLLNLNLKEVQLHVEDSLGQLPVGKNFRTLGDVAGGCDILKMRDS
jgi:hypothetical protein